jgi:aspartate aminotransferase-like enzyme
MLKKTSASITMLYGLYQALFNVLEEGPEKIYQRHQVAHQLFMNTGVGGN